MRDDPVVTDLVIRASQGDRQAWDALVEQYAPMIWCICRRYRLSDAHAKDVGQAVWLHLVEHLDSLRDPAALPGWLANTTRRECHLILRTLPADERELQNMPDDQTATAGHELLAAERDAALRDVLARLPLAGQRLLAMLISDPPVPYAEISAKLGIPVGSIGPNRRRYLDTLRRDPAIACLISAGATGGGQAPASLLNAQAVLVALLPLYAPHAREVRKAEGDNLRTGHYAPLIRVESATAKKRLFGAPR